MRYPSRVQIADRRARLDNAAHGSAARHAVASRPQRRPAGAPARWTPTSGSTAGQRAGRPARKRRATSSVRIGRSAFYWFENDSSSAARRRRPGMAAPRHPRPPSRSVALKVVEPIFGRLHIESEARARRIGRALFNPGGLDWARRSAGESHPEADNRGSRNCSRASFGEKAAEPDVHFTHLPSANPVCGPACTPTELRRLEESDQRGAVLF